MHSHINVLEFANAESRLFWALLYCCIFNDVSPSPIPFSIHTFKHCQNLMQCHFISDTGMLISYWATNEKPMSWDKCQLTYPYICNHQIKPTYMSITCDEIVTRTFFRLDEEKEKKHQIWISMKETTMTKKYLNIEYFTLTHSWKHQPLARIFSWIEQYLEKRKNGINRMNRVHSNISLLTQKFSSFDAAKQQICNERKKKTIRDSTLSCIMCVEIAQSCAFSKSLVQRITL